MRATLEEIMISFSFDCYSNEDLNLCQEIKQKIDNAQFVFNYEADKEFFIYIVYPKFQKIKQNKEKNNDNPFQVQQQTYSFQKISNNPQIIENF